jgi:hypothetical protein
MTTEQFCFWLNGFFELRNADPNHKKGLTAEQEVILLNHLYLCFKHDIDPKMGDAAHQQVLNDIHSPQSSMFNPSSSLNDVMIRC